MAEIPTVVVTETENIVVAVDTESTVVTAEARDIVLVPSGDPVPIVTASGAQGPPGPLNLFISDSQPSVDSVTKYLWIQTGLGPTGDDLTFWVEDGS